MPINLNKIPKTYADAVNFIVENLSEEEKEFIRSEPDACVVHHSVGMTIRNEWNLWGTQEDKSTELRDYFINEFGLGMADDLSGLILDTVWCQINGTEFDLQKEIQFYKDYWLKQGIDPITQEKVVV